MLVLAPLTVNAFVEAEDSHVFGCSIFWMGLFLIPLTALIRDLAWKGYKRTMHKSLREEVQEKEKLHEDPTPVVLKMTKKRWV
ncbi:hypothetical protein KUTeg_024291 [Tegillarca granosa]|uniref:Uncharacterized protein n=1 Tax=Tegillarca granosa TaxID=220873 RepID=A0ABQ9E2N6_TEGGR|nr:hypothetical protein KUTeg_024291 [Tegillarca granosa]